MSVSPRFNSTVNQEIPWRAYVGLSLWVGTLLLIRNPQQSLMAYDEGWYAQQARWIFETGDWVSQQWWGEPIHDRMMGIQWLIAAAYHLFGVSDGVARLPGAIACWSAVLLTYEIGRRCLTSKLAWWGAAILAATPIWMQAGRLAIQDIPLTALELLGILALLRAEASSRYRYGWGFLAGLTVGLCFMLKSVMVIPVIAALMPYLVWEHRRHRHLMNPALYLGLLLGMLPAVGWLALSVDRYGWLPIENTFGLILSLSQDSFHGVGPEYYLWNIPVNAFPWPLLAVPGVWLGLKSPYPRKLLWLGYPIFLLTLLTLFKTRTWYYPLQLLPFVALLAALTLMSLGHLYQERWQKSHWLVWGLTALLGALGGLMVIIAVTALIYPQWFPVTGLWRYALVVLALGVGWLIPGGTAWYDRGLFPSHRRATLWQWGWLMGPWGAIALLYATGLWGNYNPEFKAALTGPPLNVALAEKPANIIYNPDKFSLAAKDIVLLTFYSPSLGANVKDWQDLNSGDQAWLFASDLESLPPETQVLGTVGEDWLLIQIPIHVAQGKRIFNENSTVRPELVEGGNGGKVCLSGE